MIRNAEAIPLTTDHARAFAPRSAGKRSSVRKVLMAARQRWKTAESKEQLLGFDGDEDEGMLKDVEQPLMKIDETASIASRIDALNASLGSPSWLLAESQLSPKGFPSDVISGFGIGSLDSSDADDGILLFAEGKDFASSEGELQLLSMDHAQTIRVVRVGPAQFAGSSQSAAAGASIGTKSGSYGTLGCLVVGTSGRLTGKLMLLSNRHVLLPPGSTHKAVDVLHPGRGVAAVTIQVTIGRLARAHPLLTNRPNRVDASVAIADPKRVRRGLIWPTSGRGIVKVATDPVVARKGLAVIKSGSNGQTKGKVVAVGAGVRVKYGSTSYRFTNQIVIEGSNGADFARQGDSGSVVWTNEKVPRPVGLVFAVQQNLDTGSYFAYANPIEDVLSKLDLAVF